MDPTIGRWTSPDPSAELYTSYSSFNYTVNRPINAIDPDGEIVIFINGLGGGGENYWRKEDLHFDKLVQKHLKDPNSTFIDGSPLSTGYNYSAENRWNAGYIKGGRVAESIIGNLERDDNGNITETIKIITHSMGGVYGKGFVQALKNYISESEDPTVKKALVSLIADFDPYQAGSSFGDAHPNDYTLQFTHSGFWNFGWLANKQSKNAKNASGSSKSSKHSIFSFTKDISKLQEGRYEWNGDQWICQNCKN